MYCSNLFFSRRRSKLSQPTSSWLWLLASPDSEKERDWRRSVERERASYHVAVMSIVESGHRNHVEENKQANRLRLRLRLRVWQGSVRPEPVEHWGLSDFKKRLPRETCLFERGEKRGVHFESTRGRKHAMSVSLRTSRGPESRYTEFQPGGSREDTQKVIRGGGSPCKVRLGPGSEGWR